MLMLVVYPSDGYVDVGRVLEWMSMLILAVPD
jgi:hypothetical protein